MSQPAVERKVGSSLAPRTILIVGLVVLAGYIVGIIRSMGSYDTLVAVIVGPALFLVSLPALSHQARREGDGRIFWILVIGLILKLLGGIAQIYVAFSSYGGVADATGYYDGGLKLASHFRAFDFTIGPGRIVGTAFIKIVSGVVVAIIGPSRTGDFLVFSWLGFWGLFLFYR